MEELKAKIKNEGSVIGTEIVKVDNFINHQLDVEFLDKVGAEFAKRFEGVEVDKLITVETSGIAIACAASKYFGYPKVVYAKKAVPNTMTEGFYEAEAVSFTKGTTSKLRISKEFLSKGEKVLIIDDFLASGQASLALCEIAKQAGAQVQGVGVVIEKEHQGGSDKLKEMGLQVEALAIISKIENGEVIFA